MKELIEYIACALVNEAEQVQVKQERDGSHYRFYLRVSRDDMGRVIGKGGRVANAMRVLLRVASVREGKQATLYVVEPR